MHWPDWAISSGRKGLLVIREFSFFWETCDVEGKKKKFRRLNEQL